MAKAKRLPKPVKRLLSPFQSFVESESASGLILIGAAAIAFLWANSPFADSYTAIKEMPVGLKFGDWGLEKAFILWVNDLLMAVFFLFVGLEIKRELKVGELADAAARRLPMVAAVGGMVAPALIYFSLNPSGTESNGWGIPMATDIAFALGMLALLGSRVPLALKVLLTAIAIVDDLGAVLVIAVFYTENLKLDMLAISLGVWGLAWGYKWIGGRRLAVFAVIGIVMWYFMLKSGVHATVAGVLLAFTIPMKPLIPHDQIPKELSKMFKGDDPDYREAELTHLEHLVDKAQSPLHDLEHLLQPWVAFVIMPVFALMNAGFTLGEDASLTAPVSLGIFLGLLLGKPIGIAGFSFIAAKLGWVKLPEGINWGAMLGASMLAAIGFTMSLFIANLAFGTGGLEEQAKLGIISASVAAAIIGLLILRTVLPKEAAQD
ncbi:MAG: Na+/H+ antiporter NhaA [Acidobacteriota bacterium]